ncbi:MAG: PH domain-containing protein [Prolixibacteraceae bacterium]|nr:PH domain-containing protein [Prolixibacteraceae bacterium]
MSEEAKKCPFCGEEILSVAIKCKHCGEFLNKTNNPTQEIKKSDEPEKILWEGRPSHLYYLVSYIISVLLIPAYGLGLLLLLYFLLDRHCKVFTTTNKRVRSKTGIISRSIHEVSIKDIRSVNLQQGILERLFGLGSINIGSAGTAGIEVSFKGVINPTMVKEKIQELKERQ